ncbi:hypothetical protein ACU4GD_39235 [Cupriavidus basilensis]
MAPLGKRSGVNWYAAIGRSLSTIPGHRRPGCRRNCRFNAMTLRCANEHRRFPTASATRQAISPTTLPAACAALPAAWTAALWALSLKQEVQ